MSGSRRVVLALALAAVIVVPASADWPGFRGVEKQGRSESAGGPVRWSSADDARWLLELEGRAHSSPIVSDGRVYVTTSYVATRGALVDQGLEWLTFLLTGLVAILAIQTVVDRCRPRTHFKDEFRQLIPVVFFALSSALLVGLALFGPSVMNYERCEIRSWLGASLLVSLAAMLSEFHTPSRSYRRAWVGAGLIVFGILVVAAMPYKHHAFATGLFSKKAEMVLLIAMVPIIIGSSSLLRFALARRRRRWFPAGAVPRVYPTQLTLAVLGSLVGIVLLGAAFKTPGVVIPRTFPVAGFLLYAVFATWVVFIMTRNDAKTDYGRSTRGISAMRPLLLRVAIVGTTCVSIVAASVYLFVRLLGKTMFFDYQLRNPTWQPDPNWLSFFGLAVVGVVALVVAAWKPPRISAGLRSGFGYLCLATGLVVFFHANFVSTKEFMTRAVIAVDGESGEIVWKRDVFGGRLGTFHVANSPASPTPTVHRGTVYAYFGDSGVVAMDTDGKVKWTNESVSFHSHYGAGVSPVGHGNYVIIANGTPRDPKVLALDTETGEIRWQHRIAGETLISGNSRTPWVTTIDGKATVMVWGFGVLEGIDLATGGILWAHEVGEPVLDMVASLVADEERVYLAAPRETVAMKLAALGGSESPVVWRRRVGGPNVSSPIVGNGLLFMVSDNGIASCLEAATGEVLWRERLRGGYHASLTSIGDNIYYSSTEGVTTIVAAERHFREVARNELDEGHNASLAPVGDHVFIRTRAHLMRLDQTKELASTGSPTP